ncbi:MAG: SAM-dependent chlorinase/fluorinase [Candidatus Omnitrophota bacterium]
MDDFSQRMKQAMKEPRSIITLLTDFGEQDGFIGVMKGVMLQIAPHACFVDISHRLPAFSIAAAAFLNHWSYGYFPAGTVHLCVTDPGVGTGRRALIAETAGHLFVAPDNGLLTPLFDQPESMRIFSATDSRYWLDAVSGTFHGRDIFAPLAAHLARGVRPEAMGEEIRDPVRLSLPSPVVQPRLIECAVVYIDRFGNLVTNLDKKTLRQWIQNNGVSSEKIAIVLGKDKIQGLSAAYGMKEKGELLAAIDGFDRLEIAVREGDAEAKTGLRIGSKILIAASEEAMAEGGE